MNHSKPAPSQASATDQELFQEDYELICHGAEMFREFAKGNNSNGETYVQSCYHPTTT